VIVRAATAADAAAVTRLVHAAFGARPPLDPPAPALAETPATVAAEIAGRGGLVTDEDGALVGCVLFGTGPGLRLTRVCSDPAVRRQGIAAALVAAAEVEAARRGLPLVSLVARRELADNVAFWTSLGYAPVPEELFPAVDRRPHNLLLARATPVTLSVPSPAAMRVLGAALGRLLRAGDLVVLTGELAAGKTTLTQGIGAGLGVRGPVTSPTFVVAREHPSLHGGPGLLHVDAYRLTGRGELDDLDLASPGSAAVTVVEWGAGLAEGLAAERLEVTVEVPVDRDHPGSTATRTVGIRSVGGGWAQRGLAGVADLQPALDALGADAADAADAMVIEDDTVRSAALDGDVQRSGALESAVLPSTELESGTLLAGPFESGALRGGGLESGFLDGGVPSVLLGIDTSAGVCVAALRPARRAGGESTDRTGAADSAERADPRTSVHAEVLVPMVRTVLAAVGAAVTDVTQVVVGTGPAPFTGLRVGLVTARTLADALGVPLVGVCSLDVLALQALQDGSAPGTGTYLVVSDARRREVYWARYRADGPPGRRRPVRVEGPGVLAPAALAPGSLTTGSLRPGSLSPGPLGPHGTESTVLGPGVGRYPDDLGPPAGPAAVSALTALRGLADDLLDATGTEPLYLRRPDVAEPIDSPTPTLVASRS